MIFDVPGHIEMIRNGTKTQTRRVVCGAYKERWGYVVQRKRGVKAEEGIRIVMDKIWKEDCNTCRRISAMDALAEGGYYPLVFERVFRELNPKWGQTERWAFKFHVVEVYK